MPHNIGETLKKYRISAKMTVKNISELLLEKGFKASEKTIYSWESGNSSPSPDALLAMCNAYGIKDVLTAFGYDGYNDDGSICLNLKEIEHIEKYRDLDDHGKDMVDTVLDKEWKRSTADQPPAAPVTLIRETKPDYLAAQAAHERTDIEHTIEGKAYDDSIMDNDDEWN